MQSFPIQRVMFCVALACGTVAGYPTCLDAQTVRLFGISSANAGAERTLLHDINPTTGLATVVGELDVACPLGLTGGRSSSEIFALDFCGTPFVSIDPNTATATAVSDLALLGGTSEPAFDRVDTVYFSDGGIEFVDGILADRLYSSGFGDSSPTDIGLITVNGSGGVRISSMVYDPDDNLLFAGAWFSGSKLLSIDPTTGIASVLGDLPTSLSGLTIDTTERVLYSIDRSNNTLVAIDPTTAETSTIGPLGADGIYALEAIQVPEPSGILIALATTLALSASRSRKSRTHHH